MTSRVVAFAYAGARLQARYGLRPAASVWEQLEAIEDFGRYVQAARDTGLRPWVLHFDAAVDPHRIESRLREAFRSQVSEVAAWCPPRWRAFIRWLAWLPDLPFAAYRLEGGEVLPWMNGEPLRALLEDRRPDNDPAGWWLYRWRQLRPLRNASRCPGLVRVEGTVADAVRELRDQVDAGRTSGEAPRRAMGEKLARIFRRHTRRPGGAVAYLGLIWLDMRRLRGALLRRRLLA